MNRPTVTKQAPGWRVHVNGRPFYAGATHEAAMNRAHSVATAAARIRMRNDIARITEALARIEANR